MPRHVLLVALAALLTSCSSRVTEQACQSLHPGQSQEVVEANMGRPALSFGALLQYGFCGRGNTEGGVCCVFYDDGYVLSSSWMTGCSCAGQLATRE